MRDVGTPTAGVPGPGQDLPSGRGIHVFTFFHWGIHSFGTNPHQRSMFPFSNSKKYEVYMSIDSN